MALSRLQVIKISGAQLDDPAFLARFADLLLSLDVPTVIVHGGGKEISELQKHFEVIPRYVGGLRVTDETSLSLVKMALLGAVNPRIVETLGAKGIQAQGISGLDRRLILARQMAHPDGDLGRVGEVVTVQADWLHELLAANVLPVIAPICLGEDGGAYNVNADHVAGAVAAALGAERLVFITNVSGVLHNGQHLDQLTPTAAYELIKTGVITDGMIPKVETALDALSRGAAQVVITNLEGLAEGGTAFITEERLS